MAESKEDIIHYVLNHPINGIVFKTDRGGFRTRVKIGEDPVTKEPILKEHTLKGISEEIRNTFFSKYDAMAISKTVPKTTASAAKKNAPRKSFTAAKYDGMALGSRVHREIHAYINIMNYAVYGGHNSEQRLQSFHDYLSLNNNSGGVHPCTRAVLEFMFSTAKWVPIAAEWCVGDVKHQLKHATQIDMIAARMTEDGKFDLSKVILCELKTGSNNGRFFAGTDLMDNVVPNTPNAPINQAKMQLVMSAVMFCDTYQLSWNQVELYVIHCPSDKSKQIAPKAYRVTEQERQAFIQALKMCQLI